MKTPSTSFAKSCNRMARNHASRPAGATACLVGAAILNAAVSYSSRGEGFRNPPPGAFNLGRAGGRIAQVDDSSAATQNPANLVDLAAPEMQFSPTIIHYSGTFSSPYIGDAESIHPWKFLPNLFAAYPLKDSPVALGLGITVPYGIATEWSQSGAFANPYGLRYQAPYFTELMTVNLSPNVAVKITDWLQVGAGFDVMYSELTFKQFYPWSVFPGAPAVWPEGNAEAKGDGFGYGGNLGITVKPFEGHRLAITYRSPMSVNYGGDFTIDNVPASASAIGITPESDFSSQITFPTIVGVGYGIEITDAIRIEADFEWVQFSKFQSLDLNLGNDALLLPRSSTPQDWRNTYTAGIAGDWRFHPNWTLRGGYQHYQTPVPDHTISTTIPDANQNVITLGLAFENRHNRVELAYGYDFYATRNISNNQNPVFNGEYNIRVQMISVAYSYRF